MKVFTHYPALAPALSRAGHEPVLMEPLHIERGPIAIERHEDVLVVGTAAGRPLFFTKRDDLWELSRG